MVILPVQDYHEVEQSRTPLVLSSACRMPPDGGVHRLVDRLGRRMSDDELSRHAGELQNRATRWHATVPSARWPGAVTALAVSSRAGSGAASPA